MSHYLRDLLGRHHFYRVPGTDEEFVGVGLFLRDMHTDLAPNTSFKVDFTPRLVPFEHARFDGFERDAIHGANLEARFAAGAVVGVDDG